MANGSILLKPLIGKAPIHGSHGVIGTVDNDTGMHLIYWLFEEGTEKAGEQIGFLHPNGFVHFIVPNPPQELKDMVTAAVEEMGRNVKRMGAPPDLNEE